jgi:hypothetical protein
VTVQAGIEAELPFLRAEAESRMLDTWTIGADVGWTFDGTDDVQTVTPLFTTKGRLKSAGTVSQESQAGERTVVETRRELHIPWDSDPTPVNAVAQCTAIGPLSDPTLLGIIVRLSGPAPGSQQTARRLEVVEILT